MAQDKRGINESVVLYKELAGAMQAARREMSHWVWAVTVLLTWNRWVSCVVP